MDVEKYYKPENFVALEEKECVHCYEKTEDYTDAEYPLCTPCGVRAYK